MWFPPFVLSKLCGPGCWVRCHVLFTLDWKRLCHGHLKLFGVFLVQTLRSGFLSPPDYLTAKMILLTWYCCLKRKTGIDFSVTSVCCLFWSEHSDDQNTAWLYSLIVNIRRKPLVSAASAAFPVFSPSLGPQFHMDWITETIMLPLKHRPFKLPSRLSRTSPCR